jgi:hypothetical protein
MMSTLLSEWPPNVKEWKQVNVLDLRSVVEPIMHDFVPVSQNPRAWMDVKFECTNS